MFSQILQGVVVVLGLTDDLMRTCTLEFALGGSYAGVERTVDLLSSRF